MSPPRDGDPGQGSKGRITVRPGRKSLRRSGRDYTAVALIGAGLTVLVLALLLVGIP
ncbi:hypothetical protein [Methylobacterium sp. 391_Methyba4]|uniref:hypothetical protein n=1 Tax=Methylobacterium sp. 391_Methyba4 TaxID=3038924 RepID=UPI00241EAE9D|nr:hypothetical protein [Methylobacterium sp. 391_Methyba4]WFS09918.1 hypothetical protein P9K36_11850 [Methylobacterium sp. 391_Methyba4]